MDSYGYPIYLMLSEGQRNDTHGAEPTIPSKKNAKFERHCDWWLYKERHLVEKLFLKLKGFRRIATRYDKYAFTYLGFICLASVLIWLK